VYDLAAGGLEQVQAMPRCGWTAASFGGAISGDTEAMGRFGHIRWNLAGPVTRAVGRPKCKRSALPRKDISHGIDGDNPWVEIRIKPRRQQTVSCRKWQPGALRIMPS